MPRNRLRPDRLQEELEPADIKLITAVIQQIVFESGAIEKILLPLDSKIKKALAGLTLDSGDRAKTANWGKAIADVLKAKDVSTKKATFLFSQALVEAAAAKLGL